jgi:hypothetical protein
MKAKRRIPEEQRLPEPYLIPRDLPQVLPPVSQLEILEYVNARDSFIAARAFYEAKRANMVYKLRLLCKPERGSFGVRLKGDGDSIVITDSSSSVQVTEIDAR